MFIFHEILRSVSRRDCELVIALAELAWCVVSDEREVCLVVSCCGDSL